MLAACYEVIGESGHRTLKFVKPWAGEVAFERQAVSSLYGAIRKQY